MANVKLRKFQEQDVPNKVKWINDAENNQYLHYELPLLEEKTVEWFRKIEGRADRYDAVIEYDEVPVGIIGLLGVQDGRAEYYITIGEKEYKGRGIAKEATELLLQYAFINLKLKEVYLYTEEENIGAQKLFEKCGFEKQYLEKDSAINRGKLVNRYFYKINGVKNE